MIENFDSCLCYTIEKFDIIPFCNNMAMSLQANAIVNTSYLGTYLLACCGDGKRSSGEPDLTGLAGHASAEFKWPSDSTVYLYVAATTLFMETPYIARFPRGLIKEVVWRSKSYELAFIVI